MKFTASVFPSIKRREADVTGPREVAGGLCTHLPSSQDPGGESRLRTSRVGGGGALQLFQEHSELKVESLPGGDLG